MRPPLMRQNDSPKVPPNLPKPLNLADTRQAMADTVHRRAAVVTKDREIGSKGAGPLAAGETSRS